MDSLATNKDSKVSKNTEKCNKTGANDAQVTGEKNLLH